MNCDDFKNKMIAGIYGRLKPEELEAMDDHQRRCSSCEQTYRESQMCLGAFENEDDIPAPDWEKSWKNISARAFQPKKRLSWVPHYKRIMLAAGAAAVVFVIGLLAGRWWLAPDNGPDLMRGWAGYTYASHSDYAENLELVLINFANRENRPAEGQFSRAERAIVSDMLAQTRLLKQVAGNRNDPALQNLLDDIELILIGISNLKSGDRDSANQINDFIRKKSLKFRLNQLAGSSA